MQNKRIVIDKQREVYFETYLLKISPEFNYKPKPGLVVICPGGGYSELSAREAEPIALAYNACGLHAVVLNYGVDKFAAMPGPIRDLAKTMLYINEYADEWDVDADNIFVAGFSAGGHLAAALGVFWNSDIVLPEFSNVRNQIKPRGTILSYPVIDLKETNRFMEFEYDPKLTIDDMAEPDKFDLKKQDVFSSKDRKLYINFEQIMNATMRGAVATQEFIDQYSLNNHISSETVPAFIWHTKEDNLIYPANSLKYAMGLDNAGVDYELHIYPKGCHGLALANDITAHGKEQIVPECQNWHRLSVEWIKAKKN